jgi:hypothetical protein
VAETLEQKNTRLRIVFDEILTKQSHSDTFLVELLDILHFFGPTLTEADMALQNAAKTVLNIAGLWGDTEEDRALVTRRLTGR